MTDLNYQPRPRHLIVFPHQQVSKNAGRSSQQTVLALAEAAKRPLTPRPKDPKHPPRMPLPPLHCRRHLPALPRDAAFSTWALTLPPGFPLGLGAGFGLGADFTFGLGRGLRFGIAGCDEEVVDPTACA